MKLLKKIKKNLFKSLLLLFVSIFIATCNSNIVFATTESPINFSNSYKNIVEPYEVEGGYSISDVEFVKSENGDFESVISIYDERGVGVATVVFKLLQDFSISNMYTVSYNLTATELVNGIRGNIAVTDSSFLFSDSYMDKYYSKNFTASMKYYGECGNVIIPPNVKKVKVKFSNFQIYFLSSGWKSGVSFTGTYNVN